MYAKNQPNAIWVKSAHILLVLQLLLVHLEIDTLEVSIFSSVHACSQLICTHIFYGSSTLVRMGV